MSDNNSPTFHIGGIVEPSGCVQARQCVDVYPDQWWILPGAGIRAQLAPLAYMGVTVVIIRKSDAGPKPAPAH